MSFERELSAALLEWFHKKGRDFPWRKTSVPFRILIAEKLLQQTSVRDSLIEIYETLIIKYPTPDHLANADIEELRELIQPLGLDYRARDLILMSHDLIEKFAGTVPAKRELLLSLYGVGEYSARAILSFAFGEDVAVVDVNVARILYRVFAITEKFPSNPARNRKLIDLASSLIPSNRSKEFNWAMIDLGSMICLSKKPLCEYCPLNKICSFHNGH